MGEPTDVMRRKIGAFNAQDAEQLKAVFNADCNVEVPGASLRSAEDVAAFFSVYWEAFPDLHLTVDAVAEEGSVVLIQGTAKGTHSGTLHTPGGDIAPTGRKVEFTFADDYDVRGGVIVAQHLHFDRLALLEQLGVAPVPASA